MKNKLKLSDYHRRLLRYAIDEAAVPEVSPADNGTPVESPIGQTQAVQPAVVNPVQTPVEPVQRVVPPKRAVMTDEQIIARIIECIQSSMPIDDNIVKHALVGRQGKRLLNELYMANKAIFDKLLKVDQFIEVVNDWYREKISSSNLAIFGVPKQYVTPELCSDRIEFVLKYGLYRDDNKELPILAQSPSIRELYTKIALFVKGGLRFIPPEMIDEEMCLNAASRASNNVDDDLLEYIPEQFLTERVINAAITWRGRSLRNVPANLQTEEICRIAVNQDPQAFPYVAPACKSKRLCVFAVRRLYSNIGNVPPEMKDKSFFLQLVMEDTGNGKGFSTQHSVKLSDITNDPDFRKLLRYGEDESNEQIRAENAESDEFYYSICEESVRNTPNALTEVPYHYKTYELCLVAVQKNGLDLTYVPTSMKVMDENDWKWNHSF